MPTNAYAVSLLYQVLLPTAVTGGEYSSISVATLPLLTALAKLGNNDSNKYKYTTLYILFGG